MKLIVGLGNPGEKYEKTRHNVGFEVLDTLARINQSEADKFRLNQKFKAYVLQNKKGMLVKPQTFMNGSGTTVRRIVDFYKVPLSELWIIHDDLDIKLGEYKIQFGKGPKVHNGLDSVERILGTKDFWRLRIGIENRDERGKISGEEYVLKAFLKSEKQIINEVILKATKDLYGRLV